MKSQLRDSRRQTSGVDIDTLSLDELRAYNAGLGERLQRIIGQKCAEKCDQCVHGRLCDLRSQAG